MKIGKRDSWLEHRWSNTSLINLSKAIEQTPAADQNQEKTKSLAPTKTISKEDFFPGAMADENDKPKLLLFPENKLKVAWDCLALGLIAYLAVIIPYQIAFLQTSSQAFASIDLFTQAFFMLDILLHFNTAYYNKGKLICKRKLIAINYARGWLWIDVIASFPYEWLSLSVQNVAEMDPFTMVPYRNINDLHKVKLVNLLRILKLLRLARLKRILIDIEDFLSSQTLASIFSMTRLFLSAFLIAHWNACAWYLVSLLDSYDYPNTWAKLRGILTTDGVDPLDAYVPALYWAFTTMNTIGFGDIHAYTVNEKISSIVSLVISSMVFSLIIGNIGGMVSKSTEQEAEHRDKAVQLNAYMRAMKLPGELRFRVRRYLDYAWENQAKSKIEEDEILKLLSEPLREEIYVHTRGPVLRSFSLFDNFPLQFVSHLGKILAPEMFAPGDIVCEEKETRAVLYFILQGSVEIYHKSTNSSLQLLVKRKYFGEIAFFTRQPRKASARCIDFASVLSLNRDSVDALLSKMPEPKAMIELIEDKCREGDYSILKVSCYLCKTLGHVALNCNRLYLNVYKDDIKQRWLKQQLGSSHLVKTTDEPNYTRKKHKVKRHRAHMFNSVVGEPRDIEDMYDKDPALRQKVRKYIKDTGEVVPKPILLTTPAPVVRPKARPRYSIFIRSSPEPEEDGDEVREPGFNKELMERYHDSIRGKNVVLGGGTDSIDIESMSSSSSSSDSPVSA